MLVDLKPGPVRRGALPLITPAPEYFGASGGGKGGKLLGNPGFADARLPGQHDHTAMTRHGIVQSSVELRHLLMTADEYLVGPHQAGQIPQWP